MRILVPIKQVAVLEREVVLDGVGSIPPGALRWRTNEWDLCSLQAAMRLRESAGDGEVVIISVGGPPAQEALVAGLARGADRAMRVWDPALADANGLPDSDPLLLAAVLAAVAARERPDVILCGVQSADAANAATGVALAGLLDLAHVAVVAGIERDDERLIVRRELDGGRVEVLRVGMPALLTVQSGIEEACSPTLRELKRARAQPIEELALSQLGLDAEDAGARRGSRTVRLLERERTRAATMIEGPSAAVARRIAALVAEAMGA